MHILIVVSTHAEIAPFLTKIASANFFGQEYFYVDFRDLKLSFLVVGVGSVFMSTKLSFHLCSNQYQLVINAGIAGAFKGCFVPGDVLLVHSEVFGDLGVENADGSFHDIFEMELSEPSQPPFSNGKLICNYPDVDQFGLPLAKGLTVNKVHGSEYGIKHVTVKYQVDVESMEGGAFFYTCLIADVPFLEIRAISNIVEKRNRAAWQIEKAIQNLAEALGKLLAEIKV